MFQIGSLVNVYSNFTYKSFIARIVGFDYDKEVVFVQSDDSESTFEIPLTCVDPV